MSDDDGPPPVRSARIKPKKSTPSSQIEGIQKPKRVDPRFDALYGSVEQKRFESDYKFLREMQEKEESDRRYRIKCLRCIIRRIELEEAVSAGELTAEEFEEYDLSETEEEIFEDNKQMLAELKRTPPREIYRELESLQRASQLYTSKSKDKAVLSRKDEVKKQLLKKEVQLVKEGAKNKPYFPKRNVVKRALAEDVYERLDRKGGKHAVDKYLARKSKRQRLD